MSSEQKPGPSDELLRRAGYAVAEFYYCTRNLPDALRAEVDTIVERVKRESAPADAPSHLLDPEFTGYRELTPAESAPTSEVDPMLEPLAAVGQCSHYQIHYCMRDAEHSGNCEYPALVDSRAAGEQTGYMRGLREVKHLIALALANMPGMSDRTEWGHGKAECLGTLIGEIRALIEKAGAS